MRKWTFIVGLVAATAGSMTAQSLQRRANVVNGGNPNGGKCTIEVVVDGSAEIEIRGDSATLRNTGGQPPQWRRFECTGSMPVNPSNFRFAGVDGRGRQILARDPRGGNGALVRIEDSGGGAEGYTFDLYWGNYAGPIISGGPIDRGSDPRDFDRGGFRGDRNQSDRAQAVQFCQASIWDQAVSRFRTRNLDFRRIELDDNPGRQDWVIGQLAVPRRFRRPDVYRFSCSVDFRTGRVRTAQIDQFPLTYYPQGQSYR